MHNTLEMQDFSIIFFSINFLILIQMTRIYKQIILFLLPNNFKNLILSLPFPLICILLFRIFLHLNVYDQPSFFEIKKHP